MSLDRLPPHSIEAEQGVLGCCLLDPRSIPDAESKIHDPVAFYDLRNQKLWITLVEMAEESKPIETLTLVTELTSKKWLLDVGGVEYISTVIDSAPSAANLTYYLEILIEKWQARKMIQVCSNIVSDIYEAKIPAEELIDQAERDVLSVRTIKTSESEIKPVKPLVIQSIDEIEKMWQMKGATTGLKTGFIDIDRMTDGLQPGELTVVAAFPSVGKTSWAMNVAEYVAVDCKIPVGVFSVEMTARSIVIRLICSRAKLNLRSIRDGKIEEREFTKVSNVALSLSKSNIHFVDQSDMSINQLRAYARRMHRDHAIKLIIVDYLQLLTASGGRIDNKTQETAAISSGLKKLAKELDLHVIAASQLTKKQDGSISCRNGAEIHQDADNLFFLIRDEDKVPELPTEPYPVKLEVKKQRNGPTGFVELIFFPAYTRFESSSSVPNPHEDMRLPYPD